MLSVRQQIPKNIGKKDLLKYLVGLTPHRIIPYSPTEHYEVQAGTSTEAFIELSHDEIDILHEVKKAEDMIEKFWSSPELDIEREPAFETFATEKEIKIGKVISIVDARILALRNLSSAEERRKRATEAEAKFVDTLIREFYEE